MTKTFQAYQLVHMPVDELRQALPNGIKDTINIVMADGEVIPLHARTARIIWHYWEFNRRFSLPLSKKQLPEPGAWLTNKLHLNLLTVGLRLVCERYPKQKPLEVAKIGLYITEQIVKLDREFLEYATTLHIDDYIDILLDEEIAASKQQAETTIPTMISAPDRYHALNDTHNVIERRLHEEREGKFLRNGLSILVNSETLSIKQLKQAFLRGYTTEVDSSFFPDPVLNGFVEGLEGREIAQESRSGTKAAFYAAEPVQTTELANRVRQIVMAVLQRVHTGNCGSNITYPCQVREKDLPKLIGKYYLDDNNYLHCVEPDDKHLVGKVINLRFPAGCLHTDRVGICEVCMGRVHENLPEDTNAAHPFGVELFGGTSQKVISVKHDDTSSVGDVFNLTALDRDFLRLGDNPNFLVTSQPLPGVELLISAKEAQYLTDINLTEVSQINPEKVTELTQVSFHYKDKEGISQYHHLDVSSGRHGSALTTDILTMMKQHPGMWYYNNESKVSTYAIDLGSVPPGTPLIQLPFKHYSMLDLHMAVAHFITSGGEGNGKRLVDFTAYGQAIEHFDDLISAKGFKVNRAALEITLYAYTAQDPENGNYDLAKGSNHVTFVSERAIFTFRSMSQLLVYQGQRNIFDDPNSYLLKNRSPHPYDVLFRSKS